MPLHRYYIDTEFALSQQLILAEAESHHLVRVVRALVGQTVELVNGRGMLATATLESSNGKIAQLKVATLAQQSAPMPPLILVQALPRPPRLDFILEKATELGAAKIILFPGERSERSSLSAQQWQRCRLITVNALKQCGRLYLPELLFWPPLSQWEVFEGQGYFGDVRAQAPLLIQAWQKSASHRPLAFCVGPEAGLSHCEEELLVKYGWRGVKLHHNILRTDTAPLVALSLLSHLLMAKEDS